MHPVIKMYLGCQRWSRIEQRVIPWSGGWLDWDLHETRYYEWIEEIVENLKKDQDRREAARSNALQNSPVQVPVNSF